MAPTKPTKPTKKTTAKKTAAKAAPKKAATKATTEAEKTSQTPLMVPPKVLPKLPFTLPVRTFTRWAVVIVVAFVVVSSWLATSLVDARQEDLLAEKKERTAIQAQGRADVMSEWLHSQENLADYLTNSDLMRLFAAEMTSGAKNVDSSMRAALVAQIPYMQQTVKEFVSRNNLHLAALVGRSGEVIISNAELPTPFTPDQIKGINTAFTTGASVVQGAEMVAGNLVLEVHKPVYELQDEDKNPNVIAVFTYFVPMAEKMESLLDVGPLAQAGEQANLLSRVTTETGVTLSLVTPEGLTPLNITEKDLVQQTVAQGATLSNPLNGKQVLGSLVPIANTPFRIFHVFEAEKALAFMDLYRKGVYGMVTLAALALISVALLIVGHLLAQRNRARVRHQGKAMEALVRAIEIRDPYLSGHHERMARLAVNLGNDLGLPVRQRSTLYYAAQLSGVGKIFISQKTLAKKEKLTDEERQEVESHIPYAMQVLKDMEFDLPVTDVIGQFYERMDGTGYPHALKGAEINILSRVLAVCDVYCALTRPRAYRDAMTEADAIVELRKHSAQFDGKVLDTLEARILGVSA